MGQWAGDFGREYTERNTLSVNEMEDKYKKTHGITRTELNKKFIDDLDHSIKILEVGANIANQLKCIHRMGFNKLYGIELQSHAVEFAKQESKGINIIEGSAFDIPFKSGYFDLVFTSGVLIHICPSDIAAVMAEIHRSSREYIWGFEYYAEKYTEVTYRGHSNLLWKADFAEIYLDKFSDLELVKKEKFKYLENDNVDAMFLLRKK